ncbi:MAG: hypothetical protein RR144_04655 [Clostridia bacterium]
MNGLDIQNQFDNICYSLNNYVYSPTSLIIKHISEDFSYDCSLSSGFLLVDKDNKYAIDRTVDGFYFVICLK